MFTLFLLRDLHPDIRITEIMNQDPLDRLLAASAQTPALSLSESAFTTAVWRKIEARRKQSFWRGMLPMLHWQDFFEQPRLVVPALALVLLVSVVPAATLLRSDDHALVIRQSLGLDVFSENAPNMPATRLAAGSFARQ
ncbi:MAG: hypothetical protein WC661_02025 [Opitutaceae bacterium]|jgi:hypothetical protein